MYDLDAQGQRLLALLVERLKDVIPGDPRTYISYQDVHECLHLDQLGPTYGVSLQHQGLNSLADWTKAEGKPAITGIIIDRGTSMPGEGYFGLFNREMTDFQWWRTQVQQSKEFDWSKYLLVSSFTEVFTPADIADPAPRHKSTTYRILRDTDLARRVKSFHQCQCQLCGYTIRLPNGLAYAEAHHMRPLGEPNNGPDVMENILCLCPNHHAELDYGARPLRTGELSTVPGHSVGEEYIRYHNEVICRHEK
jgi:hypothetical protein